MQTGMNQSLFNEQEDHGIVHGNIRCHNVLVAEHSESAFIVKLADPSIVEYSGHE